MQPTLVIRLCCLALLTAMAAACSESVDQPEQKTFQLSVTPDRLAAYGQSITLAASVNTDDISSWNWQYLGVTDIQLLDTDKQNARFLAPSSDAVLDFELQACLLDYCQSQQTTITVRDVPIASFVDSSAELSEPNDTLAVMVELNNRVDSAVTLTLAYEGNAVEGVDYLGDATVSVAANEFAGSFNITVIDNTTDNADIDASVAISSSEQSSWDDTSFTFIIIDDDNAPIVTSSPLHIAYSNSVDTGYFITGSDEDGDSLTYSIEGGADAASFAANASSGAISFRSTPVLNPPQDADGDNTYQLIIGVSDGANLGTRELSVVLIQALTLDAQADSELALSSNDADTQVELSISELPQLELTALSRESVMIRWPVAKAIEWYALYRRSCPSSDCQDWQLRAQVLNNEYLDTLPSEQLYQYKLLGYSSDQPIALSAESYWHSPKSRLNDTGVELGIDQAYCPDSPALADCRRGRDAEASKSSAFKLGIGNAGFDFSAAGECIYDNTSALHWHKQVLSDTAYAATTHWQELIATANSQELCGFNDWRAPTVSELLSLVDFADQSMQEQLFASGDTSAAYWSQDSGSTDQAYRVSARNGVQLVPQSSYAQLRLVRSDAGKDNDNELRYVELADGTSLDSRTGLIWRRCPHGQADDSANCSGTAKQYTWQQLVDELGGNGGWRLPNIKELLSLLVVADAAELPVNLSPAASYWSSTPAAEGIWVWQPGAANNISAISNLNSQHQALLVR